MNNQIKLLKEMKRMLALVSAVTCVGTLSGCGESIQNDPTDVNSQVEEYKESHIKEVFLNNFTFSSAKESLNRYGISLSDAEIYWYLEMYKGANPLNKPDYDSEQIKLEASILAEQNRINGR